MSRVVQSRSPAYVRVSCAALCRIRDSEGGYLLGLNRDRLSQGRRVYMALGGALEYTDPALLARFDAVPENPATRDLRLFLEPAQLAPFRDWFLAREGRETSPFRELCEELVDEFAVLPALKPDDLSMTYAHTYETARMTERSTAPGAPTHYLHEIFDVAFLRHEHRVTLEQASIESGLRWFTQTELERGLADDGAHIDGLPLLATGVEAG